MRQLLLFLVVISTVKSLNITILHTNDFHGRFEEIGQGIFPCEEKEREKNGCFGGIARLATAVKNIRDKDKNVVLLDAGDRFANTIWSEVYKGNATHILVNQLNYTAITLGNHDFDYGIVNLQHFLEQIKCDVVVSNLNTSNEPMWINDKQLVMKSTILNINGEKIGIVGYIITSTAKTSNAGNKIQFLPIIEYVQKAVNELETKGITKVIAVGHAGFNVDKEVAKKVKGVDIVVGGHSNTFLYTGIPPSSEKPEGPYPFIVHPEYNKSLSVPVVQASKYSKYLGNLKVAFSASGVVTSWHGNPILLNYNILKDPAVNELVKKMKVLVDQKGKTVIGQSTVKFDEPNVCTTRQCPLGMVMVSAMAYHFKSHNATIALFSGQSIRKSLPVDNQGNVFYKDLFLSFPYRNTVDLVDLSGQDIKESLQDGYLQIKGLRVTYSSHQPKRKVQNIEVLQFPCPTNNCYKPINTSKIYKVVVNSYLLAGGNQAVTAKAKNRQRGSSVYDVIVEYFKANSPITTGTEINIASTLKQDFYLVIFVISWLIFKVLM